jgi:hypothetical protein
VIVDCIYGCGARFDDEYRTTICPHGTFAANDGRNNFQHHPEAFLNVADSTSAAEGRAPQKESA